MKALLILAILMWQTEPIKPAKQRKNVRQEKRHKHRTERKVPIFY